MQTYEIKHQSFSVTRFATVEVSEASLRAEEEISARIMDDIDARVALSIGCLPPPYHCTREFKVRMKHARSELERRELETLRMLLETYHPF